MSDSRPCCDCGRFTHFDRRTLLKAAGWGGLAWLTPVAELLAQQSGRERSGEPPQSLILVWLSGGPSQLETFDPHPNTQIAAGTQAIPTVVPGIQLAQGMERTAEQMDSLSLVRSVVSQEGDHERASYLAKSGYRPDPTLVHPSIGAILCHRLPAGTAEIPRHISILPGPWPARGGYLGAEYDAFQVGDIRQPLTDMQARVPMDRFSRRLDHLRFVDRQFFEEPERKGEQTASEQSQVTERAVRMMDTDQLQAFEIDKEPRADRDAFGQTPFGQACLAAARLVQVGVRCVEVTLQGWDTHISNHELHTELKAKLDPAPAGLIAYLKQRSLLDRTIVVCGGEFGRTPQLNPAGGRDHWPHGFSIALAGGGIRGGRAIGKTDPDGGKVPHDQGITVADLHATLLRALGIDPALEIQTPIQRPLKLSDGRVVRELLEG